MFKWGLSIANIKDIKDLPASAISGKVQLVMIGSGLLWTRFSFTVVPVNYTLASVNFTMSCVAAI